MTRSLRRKTEVADDPRLYEQVQAVITGDIAAGRLEPGERLASERVLSSRLEVSRVTVRRALRDLCDRGTLVASERSGWYVAEITARPPLQSFSQWARAQGVAYSTTVLRARIRAASRQEADELRISPGEAVFELERLRRIEGIPRALERSCVPVALAPGLADTDFTNGGSLFEELRRQAKILPMRSDSHISIGPALAREARLLEIVAGASVLRLRETVFDDAHRPFEIHRAAHRGDGYRWTSTIGPVPG